MNLFGYKIVKDTKGAKEAKEMVEQLYSTILITFYKGKDLSLEAKIDDKNDTISKFKPFYKWYFGRPQSKVFRFEYSLGEFVIRRDNIVGVQVFRETRITEKG